MSDCFLRLIPQDPEAQISGDPERAAVDALKHLALGPVTSKRFEDIRFIDQGGNFEQVCCPFCDADLTEHWRRWMEESAKLKFVQRIVETPCCSREIDLNSLLYRRPAGFGKFVLEVENPDPGDWLDEKTMAIIQHAAGTKLRQILAHY
jgi:hypothetical protein